MGKKDRGKLHTKFSLLRQVIFFFDYKYNPELKNWDLGESHLCIQNIQRTFTLLLFSSDIQLPETVLKVWLWRHLQFSVAPGPGACGSAAHGGGGCSILRFLQFVLELLADARLQGCGSEPLLREATLEKGYTGAEVGKPIDPARNLFPTKNLQEKECSIRWEVRVIWSAAKEWRVGEGGGYTKRPLHVSLWCCYFRPLMTSSSLTQCLLNFESRSISSFSIVTWILKMK